MLLTVSNVAKRLNVSQSCVYQLVDSGRLPCHRIGVGRGAIRVSEADLADYLASCRHEPASAKMQSRPSRNKLRHIKL
jgi:excisionase family DNA binding protein